jgi:acyl-CoA synthetase (AMP-forming)/AMP-acid ligase II
MFANWGGAFSGLLGVPVAGMYVKLVPNGDKLEARYKAPNVTKGYWRNDEDTKKAFDEAEAKIFTIPKPPVVVIPMEDPDPAKCICKGTGIIVHGDGHKTPCQYHGVNKQILKEKDLKFKPLIILENK